MEKKGIPVASDRHAAHLSTYLQQKRAATTQAKAMLTQAREPKTDGPPKTAVAGAPPPSRGSARGPSSSAAASASVGASSGSVPPSSSSGARPLSRATTASASAPSKGLVGSAPRGATHQSSEEKSSAASAPRAKSAVRTKYDVSRVLREAANLGNLPDELLLKIFSFLSVSDLLSIACVSKTFSRIANDISLVKLHFCRQWPCLATPPSANLHLFIVRAMHARRAVITSLEKKRDPFTELAPASKILKDRLDTKFIMACSSGVTQPQYAIRGTWAPGKPVFHRGSMCIRWDGPDGNLSGTAIWVAASSLVAPVDPTHAKSLLGQSRARSLIACHLASQSARIAVIAADDQMEIKFISPFVIGTWRKDSSIAFICLFMHHHNLVDFVTRGLPDRIFEPRPSKALLDDIDPVYGLHDVTLVLVLHTFDDEIFSHKFQRLKASKDSIEEIQKLRHFCYPFVHSHDHHGWQRPPSLPWTAGGFTGTIQMAMLMSVSAIDEHGGVFWTLTKPVSLVPSTDPVPDYVHEGDQFSIISQENGGTIRMTVAVDNERCSVSIVDAQLLLSVPLINRHFGREYS